MSTHWLSAHDFGPPGTAFDADAEALFCRRARVGLWGTICSLVVFIGLDLWVRPAGTVANPFLKPGEIVAMLAALAVLRHPLGQRHARPVMLAAFAIADVSMILPGIDRGDAGTAPVLMMTTTLCAGFLLPWGPAWQAPLAVLASAVSWTLTLAIEGTAAAAIYPAIGRTILYLASIPVAHLVEVNRRERGAMEAALRESARSLRDTNAQLAEEARTTQTLLQATATLQSHLRAPDMLERVNAIALDALACDWSSTFLWDDRRGGLALHSTVGARPEVAAELANLVFPAPTTEADVFTSDESRTGGLMRRYGTGAFLCTPVRHDGVVRALLVHGYRERPGDFSTAQRRLAVGIARATAIALENARLIADLERASVLKSEFVATMSHELRTPLNIIVGYGDMLLEGACGALEPAGTDAARRIHQRSLELLELINATLDLNRLDAGRAPLDVATVPLAPLFVEVGTELGAMAADGVLFRTTCHPADATVATDRAKLKTIVRNLLGNALKFTTAGEVILAADVTPDALTITVRDTGIGIAADQLPIVFDMFRQVDGSATRRFGGVGLGLHIVRRLATLLGGTVDVESAPGAGSIFTVRLPTLTEGALRTTGT